MPFTPSVGEDGMHKLAEQYPDQCCLSDNKQVLSLFLSVLPHVVSTCSNVTTGKAVGAADHELASAVVPRSSHSDDLINFTYA